MEPLKNHITATLAAHAKYQRRGNIARRAFGHAKVEKVTYHVTAFVEDNSRAFLEALPHAVTEARRLLFDKAKPTLLEVEPDSTAWVEASERAINLLDGFEVPVPPTQEQLEMLIQRCSSEFRAAIDATRRSRHAEVRLPKRLKKLYRRQLTDCLRAQSVRPLSACLGAHARSSDRRAAW